MRRIVEPLQQMGAPIQASPAGTAPLLLAQRPASQKLLGLRHTLPIASAQVKSCLLLAGLGAERPTEIVEPCATRDHTERMLRKMGVSVAPLNPNATGAGCLTRLIPPQNSLSPLRIGLPGDISSAAFFIVAALITPGSEITIENVLLNPGRTGLIEALLSMGARIAIQPEPQQDWEPVGNIHVAYSSLAGGKVAGELVVRMIDEFPAFAVAAAFARGETQVRDAAELRAKESDRIQALAELVRLGARITAQEAGFAVDGLSRLEGGEAQAGGDHRMGMALAIAGLAARRPVSVAGAEIIAESFPGFVSALQSLGAQVAVSR
jgi:3-phosphoshikimate 1-carboxyvinyltransferase